MTTSDNDTSDGMQINGPGDDENGTIRLVHNTAVVEGSVMNTETGEAEKVTVVDIRSRTLATLDDQDVRSYSMSRAQALDLAQQLFAVALNT